MKVKTARVIPWRADLITFLLLAGAIGAIAFDAKISLEGFQMLVDRQTSYFFTAFVILTQLAVGLGHSLNVTFRVSGSDKNEAMDRIFWWMVIAIYSIDIGSNAFQFGTFGYLTPENFLADPANAIAAALMTASLAAVLAFADEMLFRGFDALAPAATRNRMRARLNNIPIAFNRRGAAAAERAAAARAAGAGEAEGRRLSLGEGLD